MTGAHPAAYDALAWFYNRFWGERFLPQTLAKLDEHVTPSLKPGARILDLCCGTGQLARELTNRGFAVVGIDGSPAMLDFAKKNAPRAELRRADARTFKVACEFDACVSAFDSLNHVMSLADLVKVFRRVHAVLAPGARFLFDLNMEEGYRTRWKPVGAIVEKDCACVMRTKFDDATRVMRDDFTLFRLQSSKWTRNDLTLFQKCYNDGEVRLALQDADFRDVAVFAGDDVGRNFYLARRAV